MKHAYQLKLPLKVGVHNFQSTPPNKKSFFMATRLINGDQYILIDGKLLQSLRVQTDSSTTAYNINLGAAALSLRKLTDRIIQESEILQLQVSAEHIFGQTNTLTDSMSRLASSEDYEIDQDILKEAPFQLQIHSLRHVRQNEKTEIADDSLTLNQKFEQRITMDLQQLGNENSHFFTLQYQSSLLFFRRPNRGKVIALIVKLFWPSDRCWLTLIEIAIRLIILGKSQEVLHPIDKI
ncbi:MAG: hypothetical protein EZS28_046847 [Streblomastix strix]|uniref:Uncharacterized protein n=1 Tax=Streblomastix strix TaxID=222440 RepID=A0A5J4THE1_9EUKA|nr:MAG: hypothetical protein EZS28_046847 [Streblomastix strix]